MGDYLVGMCVFLSVYVDVNVGLWLCMSLYKVIVC